MKMKMTDRINPRQFRSQYFLIFCFSFLLVNCAGPRLMKEYYEPEKGGVVRFKGGPEARGLASFPNRVAALNVAQKFCRGPVKVVGEGTEMTEDSSVGQGERVKGDQDTGAVFVQFRCAVQGLRVDVR